MSFVSRKNSNFAVDDRFLLVEACRNINVHLVMSEPKLIPYGMSDFERIRTENYYYVDKTRFIPLMEFTSLFSVQETKRSSSKIVPFFAKENRPRMLNAQAG